MAIYYRPLLMGEPGVPGGGVKKYYAHIVFDGVVTVEELAKEIEKFSALSETDIEGVISALEYAIQNKLLASKIVRFNRLGNLYPVLHSEGVETEEEVLPNIIKNAGIRYRPGTRLREAFKIAKFSKYVPRVKPKPTP